MEKKGEKIVCGALIVLVIFIVFSIIWFTTYKILEEGEWVLLEEPIQCKFNEDGVLIIPSDIVKESMKISKRTKIEEMLNTPMLPYSIVKLKNNTIRC